ncbi:MAG: hypothetical protein B7Y84_07460, partial [Azorhizobium sp. 32-67-21]
SDVFADRAGDRVLPGMRIAFGHAFIEVRTVEAGRVGQVALRFEQAAGEEEEGGGMRWTTRARRLLSHVASRVVGG